MVKGMMGYSNRGVILILLTEDHSVLMYLFHFIFGVLQIHLSCLPPGVGISDFD